MIRSWFNPRTLLDPAVLADIYRHEDPAANAWLFPETVIEHGESLDASVAIPDELVDLYRQLGRPTPLLRATRLEEHLGTRSAIYLKREDVLPNGSFKISSALAQAWFGKREGRTVVVTETAAGQTGVAAALASSLVGLSCEILMVRSSFDRKQLRRLLMASYGADVRPSPSEDTEAGRRFIAAGHQDGSIAIATSEVFELLDGRSGGMNIAGSLLDFTLLYSSVIGLEVTEQLRQLDVVPEVAVGCVGGGSSFGGFALPMLDAHPDLRLVATESTAIPTLTKGRYDFDHPDGEGQAPPLKMFSLGHDFSAPKMHASGLRYHAASPIVSALVHQGRIEAEAHDETEAMEAALLLARLQGLVVSPESSYSLLSAFRRATDPELPPANIVVLVSGSGHLDLDAYASLLTPPAAP